MSREARSDRARAGLALLLGAALGGAGCRDRGLDAPDPVLVSVPPEIDFDEKTTTNVAFAAPTRAIPGDVGDSRVSRGPQNVVMSRQPEPSPFRFAEIARDAGIDFVQVSGMDAATKHFPTANGSGVALFDYDGDGKLDIYFATGTYFPVGSRKTGSEQALQEPRRRQVQGRDEGERASASRATATGSSPGTSTTTATPTSSSATAARTSSTSTTATARSPTSARRPGSTATAGRPAARCSTTTTTATSTSTSPTTASGSCPRTTSSAATRTGASGPTARRNRSARPSISSTATTATARSPTSTTGSSSTRPRRPRGAATTAGASAWSRPTSTATGGSTCSSPTT